MFKGGSWKPAGGWCVVSVHKICIVFLFSFLFVSVTFGNILPEDVLILVNSDSPTSRYVAKLYLDYHPEIPQGNVINLSGLADSCDSGSTAAEEIITRSQYNTLIAEPVRSYLTANNLTTSIKLIVTTAGMPYRIEDSTYANVIYPAGSDHTLVSTYLSMIDAASVESELTCLWYSDHGGDPFGPSNRMVNPYQGYRYSGIDLFERTMPDSSVMDWTQAVTVSGTPPLMEGNIPPTWPPAYGPVNRKFNAGNIYLTCRLDGPKVEGKTAIPAVRAMLGRAKRASDPSKGVNPLQAVTVLDDVPGSGLDQNRVYNLDNSVNYWVFDEAVNQPPDAPGSLVKDDYVAGFTSACGVSATESILNIAPMPDSGDVCVMLDRRASYRSNQADLDAYAASHPESHQQPGVVLLAGFGMNGDEGGSGSYLLNGGPGAGALFNTVNGAVFTSIESFNAVTMFTNVGPNQGKIVDFITMGGSGAIGHAFEPVSDAIVDNEFLLYNLLADSDGDFVADMTLWTIRLYVTIVTSLPSRFMSPMPSGIIYSSSGTSPICPYIALCSI